jgi:hypothetical protein
MFGDQRNPQVVVRVGERETEPEHGRSVEITDVVFTTVGPAAGSIVVEWNVRSVDSGEPPGGMWDSHIRYVARSGCIILMKYDFYVLKTGWKSVPFQSLFPRSLMIPPSRRRDKS